MPVTLARPRGIRLRGFAACLAVLACGPTPGEPVGPAAAAVATWACGPTDGLAVEVTAAAAIFPVGRPMPPYVRVTLAGTPGDLATRAGRTHRLGDGGLAGAERQPAAGGAEFATRGAVTVGRVAPDTTVEGSLDLTFPSGARVRQAFRARWQPASPGPVCR